MSFIIEALVVWFKVVYCILESWYRFIVPPKKKSIADEIVLVTGAGNGIGRQMAITFAKQGATVVLWDINKEWNDETAQQIGQLGGKAHSYVCDVTKKEEVYRIAEQVTEDVGHVTILVNNAGVVAGKKLLECPDALIERTINVNTMAIFWTIKAFAPSMVANNHGHIVTIASVAGIVATPGMVEYCASKSAAIGLHEAYQFELMKDDVTGVHMTLVAPWTMDTGMFKGFETTFRKGVAAPPLQPQHVADKVLHAIQINQEMVMLPRDMYLLPLFKSFMPIKTAKILAEFIGTFHSMDNYEGRNKKED
ncbi:epidermal retinol dehydrogenase 2-like [Glandiceps talaboti]